MANTTIDGFWCEKCKIYHPTLKWHDKYDEYATYKIEKDYWRKNIYPRFFNSWHDADRVLRKSRWMRKYMELPYDGECTICGCKTHFIDKKTRKYVCSDECRYALKEKTNE